MCKNTSFHLNIAKEMQLFKKNTYFPEKLCNFAMKLN